MVWHTVLKTPQPLREAASRPNRD
ncbi:hypothetical protein IEO21_05270 [Rhodonia placenta]|uniref:Uncharacterized protein n=1 Tax=Rhodonia placenta TaxID=104341 RepID=A0A8H7P264_9APHY|nr:hypothetical protein IEO21_05270 [Postia placenta]